MTKRREPLTFHRALTVIAARIGWDNCAAICGVTARAVRNWSDPDTDSEVRLIDALRLDDAFLEAGGDHGPFHQLFTLRLDLARRDGPHGEHTPANLAAAACASAKEAGEAIASLVVASVSAPGTCRDAIREARLQTFEAIETLTANLAALDRFEHAYQTGPGS